jgi:NAD(P)-dependent dehydrogenase (short-subunit alcohol dehydrogenase family)
MNTFQNKVAAITGAGSGIGRALAQSLAEKGCHLALSDINAEGLAETAASISGVTVTTTSLDVTDQEAVFAWAETTVAEHGKVNMVFNNAGVNLACTAEETSFEDLRWIMDVDFWGVIYGTKAFLPLIKQAGERGSIVNISSLFGLISMPSQSAYNAAKFAVRGYSDTLRLELELDNVDVGVSVVYPGGIATNVSDSARYRGKMDTPEIRRVSKKAIQEVSPEEAARVILAGVKTNEQRILIGKSAIKFDRLSRLFPKWFSGKIRDGYKGFWPKG